jgi:hypothetical protein
MKDKEDKKYTPDYCITKWQSIRKLAEEEIKHHMFSYSFNCEEIKEYCNRMIEKNKEELKLLKP